MVVICASATEPTITLQLLAACPFTCTVQAPQAAIPQPNLVPVNPNSSRMTHSSGALDSTSTSWITPLTFNRIPMTRPPDCGVDGGAAVIRFGCGESFFRLRGSITHRKAWINATDGTPFGQSGAHKSGPEGRSITKMSDNPCRLHRNRLPP